MEQHSAIATPVIEAPAVERVWPTFDHHIELDEARELIDRHKRAHPGSRTAVAFTRVPMDRMLAQPGCVGVRAYFALNPDGTPTLVLVGVTADGRDLDDGIVAEFAYPCPPMCAIDSRLDR